MSDSIILYTATICCFLLAILVYRYNKRFGLLNILCFIGYNVILYYLLFFHASGGSLFLWWFYLVIITTVQILILCVSLLRHYRTNDR